jgi:hypothetical protein
LLHAKFKTQTSLIFVINPFFSRIYYPDNNINNYLINNDLKLNKREFCKINSNEIENKFSLYFLDRFIYSFYFYKVYVKRKADFEEKIICTVYEIGSYFCEK